MRIFVCWKRDNGEINELVASGKDWIGQWFKEIKRWKPLEVNKEMMTWLRVYGIPCHV